jgi:hypothetical protein
MKKVLIEEETPLPFRSRWQDTSIGDNWPLLAALAADCLPVVVEGFLSLRSGLWCA